jgi:hypothetical protein
MNPLIRHQKATQLFSILLLLACFWLAPSTHALLPPPPPDGGYPRGNTAEGGHALFNLTTGTDNTATGFGALEHNTTAFDNTATGARALFSNTSGVRNTATGFGALQNNTIATDNTADGSQALAANTTGFGNTATGERALVFNTTGSRNTAAGASTLPLNMTGSGNTVLGFNAGGSIFTADNVICIGENVAGANVSNTTWIANVYGVTTQSGTTAPVIVSDTGQIGTVASSERLKKDICTMDKASEVILSLRPVTFHYKSDVKDTPQFGLVAEEVAKVNPALVLPDKEGKPYTVRYDQVNAMLLNEFLKEHRIVQEQGATIARQQKQIEALTVGLQKLSAQLEVSKPTPQTAMNDQ